MDSPCPALLDLDVDTAAYSYWWYYYSYGVDFGEELTISEFRFWFTCGVTPSAWLDSTHDSVKIFKSSDGTNWTAVEQFDGPPLSNLNSGYGMFTCAFATPQTARYFKIVNVETSSTLAVLPGSASILISEIEWTEEPGGTEYQETISPGIGLSGMVQDWPWEAQINPGIGIAGIAVGNIEIEKEISPGIGFNVEEVYLEQYFVDIEAGIGFQGQFLSNLESSDLIAVEIAFGGSVSPQIEYNKTISPGIGLAGAAGMALEIQAGIYPGIGLEFEATNFNWAQWLAIYGKQFIPRFYFTLTGAADDLDDIEIPISSFNYRLRSATPSYLQAVIPGIEYVQEIADRSNGEMKLEMAYIVGGVEHHREVLAQITLESISTYEGTKSKSIVLMGHKTESVGTKIVTVSGVSYFSEIGGKRRIRLAVPDMYLKPGDTIRWGAEEFIAGSISTVVGENQMFSEIGEA